MKRYIFLFTTILCSHFGKSQGLNNHWEMGYGSQWGSPWGGIDINFSNGYPDTTLIFREMEFYVTNATMSDSNGNLLFYTNGVYIANAQHDTMVNGSGLNPSAVTNNFQHGLPIVQGDLSIPVPGSSLEYYLFHETGYYLDSIIASLELYFSIIDMNLDVGMGGVSSKNQIVILDTLVNGELCATRHANGRDWWLLAHKVLSDKFYKLLITPYGITIYTQNYGTVRDAYGGASAFSPDGTKYAHNNRSTDIDIYDFDRCTGLLSNHINIPVNDTSVFGSVVFSGNSQVLYAISTYDIYQFDLTSTNIPATMQTVAVWDSFAAPQPFPFAVDFFLGELASDNRIYICATNGVPYLHVINNPDSLGLACNVQQHGIQMPAYATGVPNFPNYFLSRDIGSPCDSLTPVAEVKNNSIPIRINPNPAQNTFYLNYELPYGQNAIATIYNTLGQAVMKKSLYWYFGYLQVDCSELRNGVYTIRVENGKLMGATKFVILK